MDIEKKVLYFNFDSLFGDPDWIKSVWKEAQTEEIALGFCEHYPYKLLINDFVNGEFVCVDGENYHLVGETSFSTPHYFVHIGIWEYSPMKKIGPARIWNDRIARDYSFGCWANRYVKN